MSGTAREGGLSGKHKVSLAGLLTLILAIGLAGLYVAFEGDLTEGFLDVRQWLGAFVRQFGVAASLSLLYIEESGVPLPVPGDVYVTFLGHHAAGRFAYLAAYWAGIVVVVTAGAGNLYWISRRWGPKLVNHPRAHALHLDPANLARAERWFERRGVLAMIFGRHIPGFRVPLTVVAGTLGFPFRLFVPSVAVSTAIWAAFFLVVGDRFGRPVAHFLSTHAWVYAAGTVALIGFVGLTVWRAMRRPPPETQ